MRPQLPLVAALLTAPVLLAAQAARPDTAALQRLLVAEDHRGTGADGIAPLLTALEGRDTLLRRVAARGLGRFQRPEFGKRLAALLADPVPAVRREAATGLAQSLKRVPRRPLAADTTDISVRGARLALGAALAKEQDPTVIDALAAAIGRLPYGDSSEARAAEAAIVARINRTATRQMMQGLFKLAQGRRVVGPMAMPTIFAIRRAAVGSPDPTARRLSYTTLILAQGLDSVIVATGLVDADEQVRRIALSGVTALPEGRRAEAIDAGTKDKSPIVRVGAIVAARLATRPANCTPILGLVDDRNLLVALTAIDSLTSPCADRAAVVPVLLHALTTPIATTTPDHRWHKAAHALMTLARVDSATARPHLDRFVGSTIWGERLAATAAAATMRDVALLRRLAGDRDHNVQEAAITALARSSGHAADSLFIAALASPGYQVVLAAATALNGSKDARVVPAAIAALDRISFEKRETSRDPRIALLARIGELGTIDNSRAILRYAADFDSTVAVSAATILSRWQGRTIAPATKPLPIRTEPLAKLLLQGEARLIVTMAPSSGGGSFTIRLFAGEAPATTARLLRLAREGFYNGHVFQRVEANFVTQGGGGDASEYVGDGPFMRDELALRSQFRGTIGISARGRDTGDAQLYLNLADNPILDHEYTTAGDVIAGLDVAEGILAGDVIARVEVDELGAPMRGLSPPDEDDDEDDRVQDATMAMPQRAAGVEQTAHGSGPAARMIASFDGLGIGFSGPTGTATLRNPSDNSLGVGPDHIVQIVNSRMAVFTKAGAKYPETGRVLYGPVETRTVWRGFGGLCEQRNSGDAVVRYDQLADRWLVISPIFSRGPRRPDDEAPPAPGVAKRSVIGRPGQPGKAEALFSPPPPTPAPVATPGAARPVAPRDSGAYAMCYAVSTSNDPMGSYYRYEFVRPLFPDYPRPAVWPDGYYLPSSTGDDVIEKHTCVADRARMLRGEPATEQCVVVPGVNFLNNVDLDGKQLPPAGAPNLVLAAGGTQLKGVLQDDGIYAWQFHVDWDDPSKTRLDGPTKIAVAPYAYLCGGQLTNCVPQPGVDRRLDAQGDKLMARVVYRRIGNVESVVATHSINTAAGAGGVRWYEFRLGKDRAPALYQQGTFAPDATYRWLPSPAIDKFGNIGIGYSAGSATQFPEQRFAGRRRSDPLGVLTLREATMVRGEGSQTNTLRWEDYSQTAVDPVDDCTIWYVGDYYRPGATSYSSRIGAFRMPGCR
ncbi:MAG: peptidylprolyl isomerase [Gemmatimonadetes bacterium]|nr:peptidylprolyl isomerase [Gemmatimonadota bacterium]